MWAKVKRMGMEGDFAWNDEYMTHCANDVLFSYMLESHMSL